VPIKLFCWAKFSDLYPAKFKIPQQNRSFRVLIYSALFKKWIRKDKLRSTSDAIFLTDSRKVEIIVMQNLA